jgi:hypothetical protein
MVADPVCTQALADLMITFMTGNVPQKIANMLLTATLDILLKKNEETMAKMQRTMGLDYINPNDRLAWVHP